ncbi:hypothetical protein [Sulfurirhabdus autotrophica]|nr:hypothetical protein [Sulfurirhabdus autotrophica]
MLNSESGLLVQEWVALQNNYEQYEKIAVYIKLTSVVLFFIGLVMSLNGILSGLMVLVLWLQEAIWKTYQSRLGERILMVESMIKQGGNAEAEAEAEAAAFQLHSIWQVSRPGALGLVREYFANSVRPTVAYPYVMLLLINLVWLYK